MILTIDFGTSVTKVGLWGDDGMVALARSELTTTYPQVGWTEQDPLRWWTTVVIACAEARALAPRAFGQVDVVACSGARQTFVPVTAHGDPIGKGILWSDHRAAAEARALAERMGGDDINRARTGIPLDAGAVAAKLAWLAEHEPERMEAAHVILSPRDFIVYRMTDQLVTDATFASRSGLYDFDGNAVRELAGPALGKLPSVVPSDTVVGRLKSVPGAELGLRPGIPVVIGAGDRQCEVLGSGASEDHPMVSWGTTGNVSVPVHERPVPAPAGAVVTRAADGGWLLEGGLSAAGSFLSWLGRLLDRSNEELGRLAAESGPGARGVIAVPWLDGARAPWWRDDARAGFMGLGAAHGAADMARAVVESVAWDVLRVMEVVTMGRLGGSTAEGVTLGGAGSGLPVWVEVLTSVLGVPALRHRSGEAASAGAALLAGKALGMGLTLDQLDPVEAVITPDPAAVEIYRGAATAGRPRGPVRPGRHRVAPGGRPPRALTVRVELAYGRHGTSVDVPDSADVVVPLEEPGLDHEEEAITDALRRPLTGPPLADLVAQAGRVAVVFPDLTRPMPNRTVLPPLLAELARCGVPDDRIVLLCATGTHRQATAAEMAELIGADVVARYDVIDHDATNDDAHLPVGAVDGTPVLLQREYVEADVRIITGFVEPHFFAGFSGGPKAVCPGLAATATILEAHHPRRIADARATFVTRTGNPVHDFVRAATALAPPHLSLDVAINRGPSGDGRLRRPAACGARCRLRPRAVHRRARGSPRPSTWWCRRTVGTLSTATSTRP